MMEENRRYPGVYSFNDKQTAIFFGRSNEIKELLTKVSLEQKIILYSKSGLGKTSILRAGLLPELSAEYQIIHIEFGNYNKDLLHEKHIFPVKKISNEINNLLKGINESGKTMFEQLVQEKIKRTIWFDLKLLHLVKPVQTILFVFDQFEQLFTYPENEINRFIDQLQELLSGRIPEIYYDIIEKKADESNDFLKSEEYNLLQQKMIVKSIFSIRKDYLSYMNYLSRRIPDIQNIYYELLPLNEEQASNAIKKPAQIVGNYMSPVFEIEDEAIKKIITELTSHEENDIDTTQLQIVCKSIEDSLISIIGNEPDNNPLITGFDFVYEEPIYKLVTNNDPADFKDIFKRYYNDSIKALPANIQGHMKKVIENDLIKNQMRIPQDKHYFLDHPDIDIPGIIKYLDLLVSKHLLRKESQSNGRISYELSHDTLILAILEEKEERERKEQESRLLAEAEKKAAIERKKMRDEKKHQQELLNLEKEKLKAQEEKTRQVKRSKRKFKYLSISLFIAVLLVFHFYANLRIENKQKEKALVEADSEKNKNDSLIKNLETSNSSLEQKTQEAIEASMQYQSLLTKYHSNKRERLINEIIIAAEAGNTDILKNKVHELKQMSDTASINLTEKYLNLFEKAKILETDESTWRDAINKYDEAISLEVPNFLAKECKEDLKGKIEIRINEYIDLANKYISYGGSFKSAAYDRFVKPGLKLDPANQRLNQLKRQLN